MQTTKRTIIRLDRNDSISVEYGGVAVTIEAVPNSSDPSPEIRTGLQISSMSDTVFVTGVGREIDHLGDDTPPTEDFETEYPEGASIFISQ